MGQEERLALRLMLGFALLVAIGGAALSMTYYRYGPRPLFFVVLFGVPLGILILARLILPRAGGRMAGSQRATWRHRPRPKKRRRARP